MSPKKCPQCGYENLPTATVCFRCAECLNNMPLARILQPKHHHLKIDRSVEESTQDELNGIDAPTQSDSFFADYAISAGSRAQYNAPLVCLRCGTANKAHSKSCRNCGAYMTMPDEIHHLQIIASARSNIGQVRSNNEDNVGMWGRQGVILILVADGMGGAVAGEVASRVAKEAVQSHFTGAARGSELLHELSEDELKYKLRLTLHHANAAMMQKIMEDNSLQGMGTTSTLAIVRGNRLLIAHIGDSRAYLVKEKTGWITQITDDHSFVEALIASGHITPAQAAVHPMRSVLYRALVGQPEIIDADLYGRTLEVGDRIVLCSDGLPRHVSSADIARIATASNNPDIITQELIDLANRNGGEDNITVAVLIVQDMNGTENGFESLLPLACEQVRHHLKVDIDTNRTAQIPDIEDLDIEGLEGLNLDF